MECQLVHELESPKSPRVSIAPMKFPSGAQHSPNYIGVHVSPPERLVSIPAKALRAIFLVDGIVTVHQKHSPLVHKNKRGSVACHRLGQQDDIRQPNVRPPEPAQIALSCAIFLVDGIDTVQNKKSPLVHKNKRGSVDCRRLGQQHDIPQPAIRAPQPAQTAANPMPNAKGTRPVTMVAPQKTSADHGGAQHVEAGRVAGVAPSPALPRSAPTPIMRRNKTNAWAGSGFVSPSAGIYTLGMK